MVWAARKKIVLQWNGNKSLRSRLGYDVMRIRKQNKVSWIVYSDNLLFLQHCRNQPGRDSAQNSLLGTLLCFSLSQFSLAMEQTTGGYSRSLRLHVGLVLRIIMPKQKTMVSPHLGYYILLKAVYSRNRNNTGKSNQTDGRWAAEFVWGEISYPWALQVVLNLKLDHFIWFCLLLLK